MVLEGEQNYVVEDGYSTASNESESEEAVPRGPALRSDIVGDQCKRGGWFPEDIALKGVEVRVENCEATDPNDKTRILEYIKSRIGVDVLNRDVQGIFLPAAICAWAMDGDLDSIRQRTTPCTTPAVVNYRQSDGDTPIMLAADSGHLEIVQYLLSKGADPDISRDDGTTPIFMASQKGYDDVVRALLDGKADPNIASEGATPLYTAIQNEHDDVVDTLKAVNASGGNCLQCNSRLIPKGDGSPDKRRNCPVCGMSVKSMDFE